MSGVTSSLVPAERLLEVSDLCVDFESSRGAIRAVDHLSYHLDRSEALGIVGESGSGKSVSVLAIAGLLGRDRATVQGSATFEGRDLLGADSRELRSIRGNRIGFVFQDPMASLTPC